MLPQTAVITLLLLACAHVRASEQPNILIILTDDLGWGDPACQGTGSLVPTPHLDRLAAEGMRFTNAYCPISVCTPTRLALMTGSYPWRIRRSSGVLANWDPSCIPSGTTTVPSLAQRAGYHTIGVGKWHLGCTWTTTDGAKPIGQGNFRGTGDNVRVDVPISDGPRSHGFNDWYGFICASEQLIVSGDTVVELLSHSLYQLPKIGGIESLPKISTADYLVRVFDRAVTAIGTPQQRPWLMYVAPYAPHIPLTPPAEFIGQTRAGVYGDYVRALDHHIGRVLNALDKANVADNTLVILASDNGSEFSTTGENHRPNGPLRGTKHSPYEGGVRTPLLIRWPKKIKPAGVDNGIVALTDVLATVAQVTGTTLPNGSAPDSISFLPRLLGEPDTTPRREVAMRASKGGVYAIRSEQWKWIASSPDGELYDLSSDPTESNNLATKNPDIVKRLRKRLADLDTGVMNKKEK